MQYINNISVLKCIPKILKIDFIFKASASILKQIWVIVRGHFYFTYMFYFLCVSFVLKNNWNNLVINWKLQTDKSFQINFILFVFKVSECVWQSSQSFLCHQSSSYESYDEGGSSDEHHLRVKQKHGRNGFYFKSNEWWPN